MIEILPGMLTSKQASVRWIQSKIAQPSKICADIWNIYDLWFINNTCLVNWEGQLKLRPT